MNLNPTYYFWSGLGLLAATIYGLYTHGMRDPRTQGLMILSICLLFGDAMKGWKKKKNEVN